MNNSNGYVAVSYSCSACRNGKFASHSLRVALVLKYFGPQEKLPPAMITGLGIEVVGDRSLSAPVVWLGVLAMGGQMPQMTITQVYQHRIAMEQRRQAEKQADVDEFTELDREHRGVQPRRTLRESTQAHEVGGS